MNCWKRLLLRSPPVETKHLCQRPKVSSDGDFGCEAAMGTVQIRQRVVLRLIALALMGPQPYLVGPRLARLILSPASPRVLSRFRPSPSLSFTHRPLNDLGGRKMSFIESRIRRPPLTGRDIYSYHSRDWLDLDLCMLAACFLERLPS
jgi:hypothetical protein